MEAASRSSSTSAIQTCAEKHLYRNFGTMSPQKGNPGNIKKLAYAEIELPIELLRRGLFFIDTPGRSNLLFSGVMHAAK